MSVSIPKALLQRANVTHEIRGNVRSEDMREPILCDGVVVGFVTPHVVSGCLRLGPIYILPEYRRRGLMREVYRRFMERRLVMEAFCEDKNVASYQLHVSLGFRIHRRGNGGWFLRWPAP